MFNHLHNHHGEKIDASYHPSTQEDVLVVIAHGLTANKERPLFIEIANTLSGAGLPCLRISFAGNGDSGGDFKESCISKNAEDLSAVLDQVKTTQKIIYIGHSMGGAVGVIAAAKDDRIQGFVCLAGMVETKEFYQNQFGDCKPDQDCMWDEPEFPLSSHFYQDLTSIGSTLAAARELRLASLLIYGTADDLIFPREGEALFEALKQPKKHIVIEGGDHRFTEHLPEVCDAVLTWCKERDFIKKENT